jgi:predicted ATPase
LINTNKNIGEYFRRKFTDEYIPSVYTEGITVRKKIIKKNNDMLFLSTELPMKFITSVKSLVNCEHYSSYQLQRESSTEKFISIFQRVLKLFTFQLYCSLQKKKTQLLS